MTNYLINDFKNWKPLEYLWLFIAVAFISLANYNGTALDWATAITNVVCVILVAKGRVSNYIWGLVGVLTYGVTALNADLYGNAALNLLYYVPMQFYGMYLWHKNKPSNLPDVPTKILTKAQALLTLGVLAVATLGYGSFLATTADPFPMLDAFTAVGSVIAMWLMVKQYAEQWLIWIAINIGTVYIWLVTAQSTGASYAILAMWLVFLGNSIMGAYKGYFVRVNK